MELYKSKHSKNRSFVFLFCWFLLKDVHKWVDFWKDVNNTFNMKQLAMLNKVHVLNSTIKVNSRIWNHHHQWPMAVQVPKGLKVHVLQRTSKKKLKLKDQLCNYMHKPPLTWLFQLWKKQQSSKTKIQWPSSWFLILNLFWKRPRNISCFKKGKNLNFNCLSVSFHVSYLTYLVSKISLIVFTKHFIVSIAVLSPF